jgi:hypothetical protein
VPDSLNRSYYMPSEFFLCFMDFMYNYIIYCRFAHVHNVWCYFASLKERCKAKALELNGPDFNWVNSLVDVRALYECSCDR